MASRNVAPPVMYQPMTKAAAKPAAATPTDIVEERRDNAFRELGLSGLKRFSGIVTDELDPRIAGRKWIKAAREMADNEPTIGATLYVLEMMLRQTSWRVEPADASPQAQQYADHVEACLKDLLEDNGWQGVQGELLTCLQYGWASLEKIYKVRAGLDAPLPSMRSQFRDGLVGWRKFSLRAHDTISKWCFDPHGSVLGFEQMAPPTYRLTRIPRAKYLHFRVRGTKGNPEGYAVLRPVYMSYYMLKNLRVIEAIGIERNLAGLPVMQVPMSTYKNANDVATYVNMVRKIKVDEYAGAVVPAEQEGDRITGFKLGLLASGGRTPTDIDQVIRRYESRIAMALMTQFMLLGQDKVGSFSLADRATDLLSLGLGTVLDMRDEVFNTDAIPELMSLNGWPVELAPKLKHGDIETPNLPELSQYVATLVQSGVFTPDRKLEDYLRNEGNLPKVDTLSAAPPPPPQMQHEAFSAYGLDSTQAAVATPPESAPA